MISYIQFISDIPTLGTYWSRDKHTKDWDVKEQGSWFHVIHKESGRLYRVPLTSIAFVQQSAPEPAAKTGKREA